MTTKTRDTPATTPPPATKICTGCGDEKPIHRFRTHSRKTGTKESRCNDCFASQTRRRRALIRRRDIAMFQRLVRETQSIDRVAELINLMVRRFGGLERFVDKWKWEIDRTSELRPGSKRVLDAYQAIVHTTRLHSEATRKSSIDFSGLDDEELERILQEA